MTKTMSELVVIGGNEFNLGIALAGIQNIVEVDEQAEHKFKEAFDNPQTGIIITDDTTMQKLSPHFREIAESSAKPSIVVLSLDGKDQGLRQMIIKAIGVDVWEK